jgi:hypothetical protein
MPLSNAPTGADLVDLLAAAKRRVERMTPAEYEAMLKVQRESYVRAEMSWPKAKYHYDPAAGAKVYESYEDYCND